MKKNRIAVYVAVGVISFVLKANATLLFSEAFNYSAGSTWNGGAAGFIASGNLTYSGLADQGGNELQIANGTAGTSYATFLNQTSGQIYYSFLFNPTVVDSGNTYFTAMR